MLLLLFACTYTVHLSSRPTPAIVQLPDGRRVTTPTDVKLRWKPLKRETAIVSASGYRPLEVELWKLRLRSGRALSGERGDLTLLLIPDHGPAGTWSPADVP